MIARLSGKLLEKKNQSVLLENDGIAYEVFLPMIALQRVEEHLGPEGLLTLVIYHYHQINQSHSIPILIGFLNEVEKDFFEIFITVSGIGPKAALRALNSPISAIARAIDDADAGFLRSLPGIGPQRAKEIIAKLQGKIGRFGLIQDGPGPAAARKENSPAPDDLTQEAIGVLLQLQYKRNEAKEMVQDALKKNAGVRSLEDLLNAIYKQRIGR